MRTSELLAPPSMTSRALSAVRASAARSRVVRGVLWTALAASVTVGGVLAGALIVAPTVAKVSQPAVTSAWRSTASVVWSTISGTTASALHQASQIAATRSRELSDAVAARSSEQVGRFAVPGLALLSLAAGLSLIVARRRASARTAVLSLVPTTSGSSAAAKVTVRDSRSHSSRGRDARTPQAIEALAASGASKSDIARRTGLPIDAVQLLLSISTGSRQLHPPTA